jgi:phosphoglucomutase
VEAKAGPVQKKKLASLSAEIVPKDEFAGEKIRKVYTQAPGNHASIGGLKVETDHGWFVARPSGTEDIYKIYAESSLDRKHLERILEGAQKLVDKILIG